MNQCLDGVAADADDFIQAIDHRVGGNEFVPALVRKLLRGFADFRSESQYRAHLVGGSAWRMKRMGIDKNQFKSTG